MAELRLFRGDAQVLAVPLKTGDDVAVGSLSKRAMDAGLGYLGELFRKYVLRS